MTSTRLSTAKLRLSDSALFAGGVSLIYAAAIMLWPQAFPQLLARIFYGGYFFRTLAIALVAANGILFFLISQRRRERANPQTFGYLAFLTVTMIAVFRALVMIANEQAMTDQLRLHTAVAKGIGGAELLAYTHLGILAGIVLPYLIVRLTQDYVSGDSKPAETKALSTTAGQ